MSIPSKCPECGSEAIIHFEEPGYDDEGIPVPDWSCDACGWSGFDTAEQQEDAYRSLQADQKSYEEDTGFLKPCKPRSRIRPEYLGQRQRRIAEIDPEVLVNGWVCRVIDKDKLTCPVCNATIPIPNIPNGDCWYEPDWTPEMFDELEPTIRHVFKIEDVIADFYICQECFIAEGQLAPQPWFQQQASLPKHRTIDDQ